MAASEQFLFGKLGKNGFEFDADRLEHLRERQVENLDWCQSCFRKWHCAGDCPNKAFQAEVDGQFHGHLRCQITQSVVLADILSRIEESGGWYWKGM